MADPIPDYWPDTIKVNTLSPLNILQLQAAYLKKRTGGIVEGVVDKADSREGATVTLDILATVMNYRERVLTVTYKGTYKPYHAEIEAIGLTNDAEHPIVSTTAHSEEEFKEILRESLQSKEMNTLIQSLIARTNELRPQHPAPSEKAQAIVQKVLGEPAN